MSAKLPPEPNRCGLIAFSECETFLSLRVYQLHCRGYVDKKSIVSFNFAVEIPTLPHFLKRSSYQIIDQSDNWSTNLFLSEIRLDNSKGKPHLKSWEEARVALGYASSTSYASFVLSNFTLASYLDECTLTYEPIVNFTTFRNSKLTTQLLWKK